MEKINKREITQELKESYLDYAMSVIVSRALPDVRDGMKPVHRRILWAMWDSGLTHLAKLRKSANVVGETLGRYHPHGDIAVYDALVRMAQDFSLRYPLVTGQGNFGCFTKDTEVKLADGRNLSFGALVEEHKEGKRNYTYTVNSLGLVSMAEIQRPRLTKKNAELVKVVLDNDAHITCTPDHRFMLKDGSYKQAQYLVREDSLMPLYQRLSTSTDRLRREGYVLVYQPKRDEWMLAHHLADDYNLIHNIYAKNAGRIRHHVDFHKLNNSPHNIRRVQWGEHWQIHYTHASQQHLDPEYRKKIAAGRKIYWADPRNRKERAILISERNRENWKNPEYRERKRRFLSEVNRAHIEAHPELRKKFSERATKTLKRLWQDQEYRRAMHERIIKGNRNHTTNHTGKLKFLNICRATLEKFARLNEETYLRARDIVYPYGASPLWKTGLEKHFSNNVKLVREEMHKNHKIVRIERLKKREDVYDLTVERTHNFALGAGVFVHNSVDGDSAAAMRYTEVRLSKIAEELLFDVEKDTIDWQPNYDATREEPKVLPAKLPALLLNGALGIAVGMTTNIPPHNLGEVADAILFLADHADADNADLTEFVKGPDFPTGGIIFDKKAIAATYASGRGKITTRAKAEVEERKGSKNGFDIVITEIPYQVNKSELITRIAGLVEEKKIDGIRDLRDESDKDGLRVVVELKNEAAPQKVLNQLYQHTDLQKDFHLNMLALVDGLQPQVLSLKDVLAAYLAYRKEVVRRRTEFDLARAKERAHILEGLSKALKSIDKIIATIKKSKDRDDAHKNLVKTFKFTDVQASAILEMRLQTLASLEREKIEAELKEKHAVMKELELILKSPSKILKIIKDEVADLKEKYGDERRTKVVSQGLTEFKDEDLIPQEEVMIALSRGGYIKRVAPSSFKSQHRGGKGLVGSEVGDEDFVTHFLYARTHDDLLFFTDKGRVFHAKVYEIPPGSRISKGKAVHNFLELPSEEQISAIISYGKDPGAAFLIMVTEEGLMKKTPLKDFTNIRRTGIIALSLKKGDLLKWVGVSSGGDQCILTTRNGQSIRFKESQIRQMGRGAAGVRAMRLKKDDRVAGFDIMKAARGDMHKDAKLLIVMENGFAKQSGLGEYKLQNRGGSGVRAAKITKKTGQIISAKIIHDETEIFALSAKGQLIRTQLASVRTTGRSSQGVRIMNLKSGDRIAGAVIV